MNGFGARMAAVVLLAAVTLPAQMDRLELGLRLRTFERELAAAAPGPRRDAALRQLERAVQAFFGLDLPAVAAAIEDARDALAGREPDPAERWARSLRLRLDDRLVDLRQGSGPATLAVGFADEAAERPADAVVRVWLGGPGAAVELAQLPVPDPLPAAVTLASPADAAAGDRELGWEIRAGGRVLVSRRLGLSLVADRDARLRRLGEQAGTADQAVLEGATLRSLHRTLLQMTRSRAEETVLPGARLLAEAEALVAALDAGERHYGPARPGQFWLRVPGRAANHSVRLLVPPRAGDAPDGPKPLVLALHGMGGSENLFFDGYGDGAIVGLCQTRGWYLCAPRLGFGVPDLPDLIDALTARYPIDRTRVVMVGHSMGAAAAIGAAGAAPGRYAAVAALGGGGAARPGAELGSLPFFVAAGERDFGLPGARALARRLEAASAPATFREYPGVEHLAIVQMALPDVFVFFDRCLAGR